MTTLNQHLVNLKEYRQNLYQVFDFYADTLMNLVDALSSNTTARSVVELSLNPAFKRSYSALFKGVAAFALAPIPNISQEKKISLYEVTAAVSEEKMSSSDKVTAAVPKETVASMLEENISSSEEAVAPLSKENISSSEEVVAPLSEENISSFEEIVTPVSEENISSSKQFRTTPNTDAEFQAVLQQTVAQELREQREMKLIRTVVPYLPHPKKRPFWLFGVDVTPQPRPFAVTLKDRGFVHVSYPIQVDKPIAIGHQYSVLAYLPEKEATTDSAWLVPLSTRRVGTSQDKELIGFEQLSLVLDNKDLPFQDRLIVQVADASYSKRAYLFASAKRANLVTIARLRSNRVFYRQPNKPEKPKKGHPKWYGERFALKEPSSWHSPVRVSETTHQSHRGRQYQVVIEEWDDMLMKGEGEFKMHLHPFTLVRIRYLKEDGQPAFKNDLWLCVIGERRKELNGYHIHQSYQQRFDMEHYFRFGKQRLLMDSFQTPEVEREESWWDLVQMAYTQLWLAAPLAISLPRPWETALKSTHTTVKMTPSLVQRDFGRISRQIGTPARAPKVRNKSAGRRVGSRFPPRPRIPVVKKGKSPTHKAAA